MNLILVDDDNNIYNFTDDFWTKSKPLTINRSYEHRTNNAGATDVSDGMPKERIITIEGLLWAKDNSLTTFETADRALKKACLKGGKLYYSDDEVSRYMEVKLADIDESESDGRTQRQYSITFNAEVPFWQDETETNDINVMTGNPFIPDTFTIDFSDSDWLYIPQIKIEANKGSNVPSVVLQNNSDSNKRFTYTNANFTVGKTFIINGRTGIVTLEGVDDFAHMVAPWQYLRLLNKSNTFEYTGNACTITVTYRKLYA
jgi:hypothetical protein